MRTKQGPSMLALWRASLCASAGAAAKKCFADMIGCLLFILTAVTGLSSGGVACGTIVVVVRVNENDDDVVDVVSGAVLPQAFSSVVSK